MSEIRFELNQEGIDELGRSDDILYAVTEVAEEIADTARSIGPVLTGGYVEDITVTSDVEDGVARAVVSANKFTAGFIEFGTIDTPTFATLRTSVEMCGYSLS